jgi:hypothetical protein
LIGGYVGQDLRVMVDTQEAGNGSIIWIMMWYSDAQWKQVIRTSFSTCLSKICLRHWLGLLDIFYQNLQFLNHAIIVIKTNVIFPQE